MNPFDDKPQPGLFIADIVLERKEVKTVKGKKEVFRTYHSLPNRPVLLTFKKFPTKRYELKFIQKLIEDNDLKIPTEETSVSEIKNIRFSSKIQWKFDYDVN